MPLVAATKLCGAQVLGRSGDALGTITDFMADCEGGRIAYAVLAHGGVLGIGEKLFAVPWSALQPLPEGRFRVEASADQLNAAAGINKDAWPAEAPEDWLARLTVPR